MAFLRKAVAFLLGQDFCDLYHQVLPAGAYLPKKAMLHTCILAAREDQVIPPAGDLHKEIVKWLLEVR